MPKDKENAFSNCLSIVNCKSFVLNNITLLNLYCGMERGRRLVVRLLAGPLRLDTLKPTLDKKMVKVKKVYGKF